MISKLQFTILFILLILNFFAQDLPYYVSSRGLLTWIPLKGTTLDKSGNGNDAIGNKLTSTEDRFGKSESAIYLDGINSYLKLEAENPDLMLSNDFTIAFWVSPLFSLKDQYILSKGDKLTNEFSIIIQSDNNMCFERESNIKFNCTPIIKNQWQNVALVIQNSVAKIYLNGKFVNMHPLDSKILSSPFPYVFGAIFENGTSTPVQESRYNGKLDDIAIWNRVLSDDEILLFYKGEEN